VLSGILDRIGNSHEGRSELLGPVRNWQLAAVDRQLNSSEPQMVKFSDARAFRPDTAAVLPERICETQRTSSISSKIFSRALSSMVLATYSMATVSIAVPTHGLAASLPARESPARSCAHASARPPPPVYSQ
jgi:hypothetical protein